MQQQIEQKQIAKGLCALQTITRGHTESLYLRLHKMQSIYFSRTPIDYSTQEKKAAEYYLNALKHKFHMAALSLEQLWGLVEEKQNRSILEAIEQSLDKLDISDNELVLTSFAFETFLFQARAYIDFYMLYICYFLKTEHEGKMSRTRFRKSLERVIERDSELTEKASKVLSYFDIHVFGEYDSKSIEIANWGKLITEIRDKTAHRDIIRPSFESEETLMGKILLNWPTIQGITYHDFHTYMQNGMFDLIKNLSEILYDLDWATGLEWASGEYRKKWNV